MYILCQKTEYTKGNLALSTKQWHWAGPCYASRAWPRLLGSVLGRGGTGRPADPKADTSCQVCAHGSAPRPTEPREGQGHQCPFTAIGIVSRNRSSPGLLPEKEINPTAFECTHRAQPLGFCKTTPGVEHPLQEVLPITLLGTEGKGTGHIYIVDKAKTVWSPPRHSSRQRHEHRCHAQNQLFPTTLLEVGVMPRKPC